jgi:hypothetical protein
MVDDSTLCSIRIIIDYMYRDEEKSYEESDKEGKARHIFRDILNVREWLDNITGYRIESCPKCGALAYEIHGEGITSDDRHYPLENCTACGYARKSFDDGHESWLIDTLESWDTTFEKRTKIPQLTRKLRKRHPLSAEEYDEILFHLWQKFSDT